jgi:cytochrome d ubiquinol oxidase subunit II
MNEAYWFPVIFLGLMGLAIFVYAILDGYDLGVGILLPTENPNEASKKHKDIMIASIGPFWDANETWLVLAVGIMLIAFPEAHSVVLYHLYLPATIMLIGLILRGVAFDFRAKTAIASKPHWDRCFRFGSILTSFSQGYMLGLYVIGFQQDTLSILFAILSGLCVTAAYAYIGACWLVFKTEGALQLQSAKQAKLFGRIAFLGIIAVCLVNPFVNPDVFKLWFESELIALLWSLPLICFFAFYWNDKLLSKSWDENGGEDEGKGEGQGDEIKSELINHSWLPFLLVTIVFLACFMALAVSFFPAIVPNKLDVWEAASSPESLKIILIGVLFVVPFILAYTIYSYWVFRGKATDLSYD